MAKKSKNNEQYIIRTGMVCFFLFVFAIVVIYKLVNIQILDINSLANAAAAQSIRKKTIQPERGLILDRNNNILATSLIKWDIGARYIDLKKYLKIKRSTTKLKITFRLKKLTN